MTLIACPICEQEYSTDKEKCTHCEGENRERLTQIAQQYIAATKALKFFSYTIGRGLSDREATYILNFLKARVDFSQYSEPDLLEWLQKLWCGNYINYIRDGEITEYESLLNKIPHEQLILCHNIALQIAHGSGRKPTSEEIMRRIQDEFGGRQ